MKFNNSKKENSDPIKKSGYIMCLGKIPLILFRIKYLHFSFLPLFEFI